VHSERGEGGREGGREREREGKVKGVRLETTNNKSMKKTREFG
jgi:hypothetical protein